MKLLGLIANAHGPLIWEKISLWWVIGQASLFYDRKLREGRLPDREVHRKDRAVLAPRLFAHAHDHAADDLSLLDRRIGSGFFHRSGDDVAQPGPQSQVAPTRQDTGQPACAAIIGDLKYRSHSNHKKLAFSFCYISR